MPPLEDCESFARRTFTTPKIRTFTTPKFGHFPPPKTKHLPGGQLPPPIFSHQSSVDEKARSAHLLCREADPLVAQVPAEAGIKDGRTDIFSLLGPTKQF